MNKIDAAIRRISAPVLALAVLAMPAGPAAADDDDHPYRSVTVQGTGEVTAVPDEARVMLGVVTQAADAATALRENSAAMAKVFASLEGRGIAKRDIATRSLNLSPIYEDRRRAQPDGGAPEIKAYRAQNGVSVRVRDIAKLGGLLDALVAEGANRLDGVQFSISETTALGDEARRLAIADAARKAALYATAADARLGKVISIAEGGASVPRPMMMRAARLEAARDVAVAPGEQTIGASVSVTYALD